MNLSAPAAAATPAPTTPAAPAASTVRRAPNTLTVPSLDDGSASASATLHQVASYVTMLGTALGESAESYARLVKRGFLDDAISYAQYAYALVDYDKSLDDDGFKGMIEGGVMEALKGARSYGTPVAVDVNLRDELDMARAAAANAADALALLATKHA
jgi:hypothetical protein